MDVKIGDKHDYLECLHIINEHNLLVKCHCGRILKMNKSRYLNQKSCGCSKIASTYYIDNVEKNLTMKEITNRLKISEAAFRRYMKVHNCSVSTAYEYYLREGKRGKKYKIEDLDEELTIQEICKLLNVEPSTFHLRKKTENLTVEETYKSFKNNGLKRKHFNFEMDGKIFKTKRELAEYLGINHDKFTRYINRNNCSVKEAIDFYKKGVKKSRSNGISFQKENKELFVKDIAEEFGLKPNTVYSYMYKNKCGLEKAYDYYKNHNLQKKGKSELHFIKDHTPQFVTIKEISDELPVKEVTLRAYMRTHNCNLEEAYNYYKTNRVKTFRFEYIINGEVKTLKEISNELGVKYKTFANYVKNHPNLSIEEIIEYYSIKNQSYN